MIPIPEYEVVPSMRGDSFDLITPLRKRNIPEGATGGLGTATTRL